MMTLTVLSMLIMDHAILYVCHKEAVEVTLNFSCGPTELPSSSFSPLSPPALRVVCLWPWEGLAQSAVRLSHGGVLRENADLLSSLALCLSFFSLSFFPLIFCPPHTPFLLALLSAPESHRL